MTRWKKLWHRHLDVVVSGDAIDGQGREEDVLEPTDLLGVGDDLQVRKSIRENLKKKLT